MASGREVILGLRIAGAAGYLDAARVAREVDTLDRILATLYKLETDGICIGAKTRI